MNLVIKENTTKEIALNPLLNLKDLIDSFINSQDVKLNSKKLYRRTLKQFFKWIDSSNILLSEVKRTHILDYKTYLLNYLITTVLEM